MGVSSSTNQVTITLNLVNQKATVTGLQSVAGAVQDVADAVTSSADEMVTSSEVATAAVTSNYQKVADEAESAALRVEDSNEMVAASMKETAATTTTAADSMAASFTKVSSSAKTELGSASTSGVSQANQGLLGLLGNFKVLAGTAIAYSGIKVLTGYSTALAKLSTLAGFSQKQLAGVNAEIQKMAVPVGQTPTALANAFYSPASEGFTPAQSAMIVKAAANLSNISGAPLSGTGGTSYAISTMLQSQGLKPTAGNVANVAGLIRGATSSGDMTMSDFLGAESTGIFNTAKTYGVSDTSMSGALDYFTSQGVPAQEAATRMRMTLSLLTGQSASAAKYGHALGLDASNVGGSGLSQQLAGLGLSPTKMSGVLSGPGGIASAFSMITKSMAGLPQDQQEALWSKLFGGGRSDTTAMQLAQGASDGLLQNFEGMVTKQSSPSALAASVKQQQQTPAFQWKQLEAEASKTGLVLGKDLLPAFEATAKVLGPFLAVAGSPVGGTVLAGLLLGGALSKTVSLVNGGLLKIAGPLGSFTGRLTGLFRSLFGLGDAAEIAAAKETALGNEAEIAAGKEVILGDAAVVAAGKEGAGALGTLGKTGVAAAGTLGAMYVIHTEAQKHGPKVHGADWYNGGKELRFLGKNLSDKSLQHDWNKFSGLFASGGIPSSRVGAGFMTSGPRAIVGEGNPAHPEFVIPTDPAYRGRALGLLAQAGSKLMAAGGTIGGDAGVGSGVGLLRMLAQLSSGSPSGQLAGILGSLTGSQIAGLPGAERTVTSAIGTAVPPGLFRSLVGALIGQVFGMAISATHNVLGGSGGLGALTGGGTPTGNKAIGAKLAGALGWGSGNEWTALMQLWTKESQWNNTARNPSSGAYGIAQALPQSKYPKAGQAPPWGTSDPASQINWGLSYIKGRYGDPLGAWAHESQYNWYARGGRLPVASYDSGGLLPEGLSLAINQTGKPEPVGHNLVAAGGQPIVCQVVLPNGKVLAEATFNGIRQKSARL